MTLAQQPNMTEVIGLLRELPMSSLSMEADLRDVFEMCMTRSKNGQGEKAQELADEFDELRHTEKYSINSSHHRSKHLTTRVLSRKNRNNI